MSGASRDARRYQRRRGARRAVMRPKQPQPGDAKNSRNKAAPAAVPQALRNAGNFNKRPNIPCLGRFQRRQLGENNITRHGLGNSALRKSNLGSGGKLRRRGLLRRDSGQHRHQRIAASLLEDRLPRASQRKHTRSGGKTLCDKVLTPARADTSHAKLSRLAEMRQHQIVLDIARHFRLRLVEVSGQPCPHDRIHGDFLGQLVGAADMII